MGFPPTNPPQLTSLHLLITHLQLLITHLLLLISLHLPTIPHQPTNQHRHLLTNLHRHLPTNPHLLPPTNLPQLINQLLLTVNLNTKLSQLNMLSIMPLRMNTLAMILDTLSKEMVTKPLAHTELPCPIAAFKL